MRIVEIYETEDGKRFDNSAEAYKHETILECEKHLKGVYSTTELTAIRDALTDLIEAGFELKPPPTAKKMP
jgi:hypothetical protein